MSLATHQPELAAAALETARWDTLSLVEQLDEEALGRVVSPLLSPLLWDLGHIASFEREWLLDGDRSDPAAAIYDPFEQPRALRGGLPLLSWSECQEFMAEVRSAVLDCLDSIDPFRVELVLQHELQHTETMLQLLVMLDDYEWQPFFGCLRTIDPGLRWVRGGGECTVGSVNQGFVYDNECGLHTVTLEPFEIASRPVTNEEYREWIDAGGYQRQEWWSDDGWSWRAEQDAQAPLHWRETEGEIEERMLGGYVALDPGAPVCHVSWFEANAYARAHGARLPSESEWESVATDAPLEPGNLVAGPNLNQSGSTRAVGGPASPSGCSDLIGQVWEWTSSEFSPYPGFEPFVYERYSAPFFNAGYRVLRGGSWASRSRTISPRFRNWDLPQRRQIFSGFRLARDA